MRKLFCDVCKEEVEDLNNVGVPCHLWSMRGEGCHMGGYRDNDGNPVSGRNDTIEMCNKCLNTAYIGLLKAVGIWGEYNE